MATLVSKTFDTQRGAVFAVVKDAILGNQTNHTLYVASVPDVNAAIDAILVQVDADAQVIHDRMVAAGWVASGS